MGLKSKLQNKKAFTLIELIVVIAIVAVLAAVGIPAVAGQVTKSQKATADTNSKLVAQQVEKMIIDNEAAGTPSIPLQTAVAAACGVDNASITKYEILGDATNGYYVDEINVKVGNQTGKWTKIP